MGPYKYTFRRYFKNYIEKAKPFTNVIDCACANAKFAYLFDNVNYLGVDISSDRIKFCKEKYKSDLFKTFKMIDVTSPEVDLGNIKYDLVVSTHTFSHFPEDKKIDVAKKLIAICNTNGKMIIQLNSKDKDVITYLLNNLNLLKSKFYKGWLSNMMENHLSSSLHKNIVIGFINNVISYLDIGKEEVIFLFEKNN